MPVDEAFEVLIERFGGKEKASEEFEKNPEVLEGVSHFITIIFLIPTLLHQCSFNLFSKN